MSIILHPLNLLSSLKSLVSSSSLEPGHPIRPKGQNRMGKNRQLFLLISRKSNTVTEHQGAYMRPTMCVYLRFIKGIHKLIPMIPLPSQGYTMYVAAKRMQVSWLRDSGDSQWYNSRFAHSL
ncbi:hypothetical protein PM082_010899 [Marasmius tenuissimus]|nr:hypothetical protein PM082_010899 [Marasmius tenuissimus]